MGLLSRLILLLAATLAATLGGESSAATVGGLWTRAEAAAQACDLASARRFGQNALEQASNEWPQGQEGFFPLHYALASWSNATFDYASGESHARAALAVILAAGPARGALSARARAELAHALVGLRRFAEAEGQLEEALGELPGDGELETRLAIGMLRANLEFARGRVAAGANAMEETGRMAAGNPQLSAAVSLPLADARRRTFDFAGAQSALRQAQVASQTGQVRTPGARLLVSEAALLSDRGDLAGALKVLQRARERAEDPCDPLTTGDALFLEGQIHLLRREISDARVSMSEAIERIEALGLQGSPRYGEALSGLAGAVAMAGDLNDANRLFNAAAKAVRTSHGAVTSLEALIRLDQAYLLAGTDRSTLAVAMAREAIKLLADAGDATPIANAYAEATLGHVLKDAGQYAEASRHFASALAAFETLRGHDSFDAAPGLLALGEMSLGEGDLDTAWNYLTRALAAQAKGGWSGAQAVGLTHARLAAIHALEGRRERALDESALAVAVLRDRVALGEGSPTEDAEVERARAGAILDEEFALLEADAGGPGQFGTPERIDRVLLAGQLGASLRTGQAIAQMAHRLGAGDDRLAKLIRQRQDLVARLRADQQGQVLRLTGQAWAGVSAEPRSGTAQAVQELTALSREIEASYGKASLVLGSALATREQVANKLDADEAVLAIFVRRQATFVVVIRRDNSEWYRVHAGRSALDADVRFLRATLESRLWSDSNPPKFPLAVAARLHDLMIAPAKPLLKGVQRLIIVPDGPLMSLPLSLLVGPQTSELPIDITDYRKVNWLVRRYSLETLPSLASFVVLHGITDPVPTDKAFLGIGDPILMPARGQLSAAGVAQLEDLKITSAALKAMAEHFDTSRSDLLLRERASEVGFRSIQPQRYAVLAFATHALVTGELVKGQEPALVLSVPPQVANAVPYDDGLLTASEVTGLQLRAQFVILLACNTAADDGTPQAEPFTGLVKSFFYAGAHSVLASHWAVEARASTRLVQDMVGIYRNGTRKSDAWRQAQLSMIDTAESAIRAHPHYWAGFQLIGTD